MKIFLFCFTDFFSPHPLLFVTIDIPLEDSFRFKWSDLTFNLKHITALSTF